MVVGVSVLVPVLLGIYAVIPTICSFDYSDTRSAFFPPFSYRSHATNHNHMGAEYWHVAQSICRGDGYSSPFGVPSGPTAWMPPALSTVMAEIHLSVGENKAWTVGIYVLLNILVLAWVAWNVARSTVGTNRWLNRMIPVSILVVCLANFNDNFQRTHDGTWLLFIMHAMIAFVMVDHDWFGSRRPMIGWGLIGGVASLSSPAILVAWLAMTVRYAFLLRRPEPILVAAGAPEPMALATGSAGTKLISDGESKPVASAIGSGGRLFIAVLIAFVIQTPWLVRNYIQFSKFVPIKNNGLFELEQSLLRDDDGVVDFGVDLHHPYGDRKEADLHAELGEVAYIEQRVRPLREKFWERKWVYVEHCCNRVFAMLAWQMPLTPNEERYSWTHVARSLYAVPWIIFLTSLIPDIPLTRAQKNVLLIAAVFLLPYALLSYYSRYMIPLMGVRCLAMIWGIERWIKCVSTQRFRQDP